MSQSARSLSAVSVFNFQSSPVRVFQKDGQPWFVAADVCEALEYKNSRKAVADHLDDDERCNQSLQRGGTVTLINESGLYALVLRSRKPEARKFAKWVTSEVLPAIRKTGGYCASSASLRPAINGVSRNHLYVLINCMERIALHWDLIGPALRTLRSPYASKLQDHINDGHFVAGALARAHQADIRAEEQWQQEEPTR